MQNLTQYFDLPPPLCLFTMIVLEGCKEDLWVFTGETSNAKAKSSENFPIPDQKWPNFCGFPGLVVKWYKRFQFLLQKAHSCPLPRRLSHFAWRSVEGNDPHACPWKKAESHRSSLWNDVSPLAHGCTPIHMWCKEHHNAHQTFASTALTLGLWCLWSILVKELQSY